MPSTSDYVVPEHYVESPLLVRFPIPAALGQSELGNFDQAQVEEATRLSAIQEFTERFDSNPCEDHDSLSCAPCLAPFRAPYMQVLEEEVRKQTARDKLARLTEKFSTPRSTQGSRASGRQETLPSQVPPVSTTTKADDALDLKNFLLKAPLDQIMLNAEEIPELDWVRPMAAYTNAQNFSSFYW
jgi:hypothetical protein